LFLLLTDSGNLCEKNIMDAKKILPFLVTVSLLPVFHGRAQEETPDLSRVKILATHVAGSVYMLEATGDVAGNIAVSAGTDGILLVDTQFAPLSGLIRAELEKIHGGKIRFIINTHHHADHTHGNGAWGDSAIRIGHAVTRKRMLQAPGAVPPNVTFHRRMSLIFNGEEIELVHFSRGHTDNDVVVFFRGSNVVHTGDLWNSGTSSFPTVDLEAGGTIDGMLENIEALIRIIPPNAKIIPGHYGVSNLEGLKATRDMFRETILWVEKRMAEGRCLEEMKREGFPSRYDSWGTAYTDAETWMENIYLGLKRKMPENVARIQQRAERVFRNRQGFWEAEFEDGHLLVYIPAGAFPMGSEEGLEDEKPVHEVWLDGYWLGKFPVTVGQFKKFVEETGYVTDAEKGIGAWQFWKGAWVVRPDGNWKNPYFKQGEDHPVVSVSWNDATAYCRWLSAKTGLDFKLPIEAQWEKGARGTDRRMYPWGNGRPDGSRANYADLRFWKKYGDARPADRSVDDGYAETSPVGSFPAGASPYGLMDMAGNVWEWCLDIYHPRYYGFSPFRNPAGPPPPGRPDQERVNRGGGSWTDRSGYITPEGGHNLRAAARTGDEQNSSDDHMGFRICLVDSARLEKPIAVSSPKARR